MSAFLDSGAGILDTRRHSHVTTAESVADRSRSCVSGVCTLGISNLFLSVDRSRLEFGLDLRGTLLASKRNHARLSLSKVSTTRER